jgi:hypothetical protein
MLWVPNYPRISHCYLTEIINDGFVDWGKMTKWFQETTTQQFNFYISKVAMNTYCVHQTELLTLKHHRWPVFTPHPGCHTNISSNSNDQTCSRCSLGSKFSVKEKISQKNGLNSIVTAKGWAQWFKVHIEPKQRASERLRELSKGEWINFT